MGLMRMAARTAVISGTATAVSGRVAHRQAGRYSAQEQQAAATAQQQAAEQQALAQQAAAQQAALQQAAAPVAVPEEDETVAALKQLASLHAAGILSDAEFAAAKAKALGI